MSRLTALGTSRHRLLVQTGRLLIKLRRYETARDVCKRVSGAGSAPMSPGSAGDFRSGPDPDRLHQAIPFSREPVKLQLQGQAAWVAMSLRGAQLPDPAAAADCQVPSWEAHSPQRPAERALCSAQPPWCSRDKWEPAQAQGWDCREDRRRTGDYGRRLCRHLRWQTPDDARCGLPGTRRSPPSGGPETVPGSAAAAARRAEPSLVQIARARSIACDPKWEPVRGLADEKSQTAPGS